MERPREKTVPRFVAPSTAVGWVPHTAPKRFASSIQGVYQLPSRQPLRAALALKAAGEWKADILMSRSGGPCLARVNLLNPRR